MARLHIQSKYATDAYSTHVQTVCGISVKRDHSVRFRSDVAPGLMDPRADACKNCIRAHETD